MLPGAHLPTSNASGCVTFVSGAIDRVGLPEQSCPVVPSRRRLTLFPSGRRITLLIVVVLIGILPTAYVTAPDPSWVAGYWDDDDLDCTVVSIAGSGALDVAGVVLGKPVVGVVEYLQPADPAGCPKPFATDLRPRGPPRELLPTALDSR